MPCVKHAGAPLENATFDEENMESISEFAEQIISCGAHRIVLSGPRGEKRYKKSTFSLVNGQYFIERLTEKQAFHEYCEKKEAAMRICSDFEGYTQVNAWNGEREFTAKLTKKGNLLTGSRACTAAPKAVESQNRKKNTSFQRALSSPRWQTWVLWQVTVRYTRLCTISSNR